MKIECGISQSCSVHQDCASTRGLTNDIGYPKFIHSGEESEATPLAAAAVNNFAVGTFEAILQATVCPLNHWLYWLSRPGGPGLLTHCRCNDFELYRPTHRAGLDPLTTTQEGVTDSMMTLLYCRRWVKPCGKAAFANELPLKTCLSDYLRGELSGGGPKAPDLKRGPPSRRPLQRLVGQMSSNHMTFRPNRTQRAKNLSGSGHGASQRRPTSPSQTYGATAR
jgi:hypothetical protein